MSVELTIVVENTAPDDSLVGEVGLSVHVAAGGLDLMFDTGATPEALLANAPALSIDLTSVEGVVISHGHCDHTGGIDALLTAGSGLRVHAHPGAFAKRWSDRPGEQMVPIGWQSNSNALERQGAVFYPILAPELLGDGVLISGPIGGPQPEIDRFVVRTEDGLIRDTFADEVFLMLRGSDGWVILTGCCHRGLKNTLRTGRFLARGEPIIAVVGGLHLAPANEEDLAAAVAALTEEGVERVYPCHCTGRRGSEYLAEHFIGQVEPVHAGTKLSF